MLVQERERTATGETWAARPRTAKALRILAWVGPIVLSVATTALLARVFPRPESRGGVVLWWIALSACATAVLAMADRGARRLLPLTALFQLSLVFPDQAPSRFKAALRTGTVRQLEERVQQVKAEGLPDDPILAAETLIELVAALSKHDRVTRGHAERVRAYARMIGEEMNLDPDDIDKLHWAALLHDVGKLFVPAEILNKPGLLTDEEYEVVKIHPVVGAELCEPLRGWLGDWVEAVGQHHEKWDGTGYPNRIAGEDISLAARIVSVADVYDVITSARSYKAPCSPVEARQELARCAGTHFDPRVVRAFMSVSLGRLRMVMGPLSWLAQVPLLGQASIVPAASMAGSGLVTAGAVMFGGVVDNPKHLEPRPAVVEQVAPDRGSDGTTPTTAAAGGEGTTMTTTAGSATTTTTDGGVLGPVVPPTTTPGVTVPPTNQRPVVAADWYTTSQGAVLNVSSPGVLANDADSDGDALVASLATDPAHGTATVSPNGTVRYTPAPGFSGSDTFTYAVSDGQGGTASTTVTVSVTALPPAPPAAWYLGTTSSGTNTRALAPSPGPPALLEPDWDGDWAPGLTVKHSDGELSETSAKKMALWATTPTAALRLTGAVRLQLWSTIYDFRRDEAVVYSVWLQDCASNGTDCRILTSRLEVEVESWNGGVFGWVYREINVGSVDTTVAVGRQLRLRLMFEEKDVWVAMSRDRASRLLVG